MINKLLTLLSNWTNASVVNFLLVLIHTNKCFHVYVILSTDYKVLLKVRKFIIMCLKKKIITTFIPKLSLNF